VGREIPEHPATAVEEHEHRQLTLDPGRPDDGQAQRLAVDLNSLLADIGFWQRQLDSGLRAHQYGAGLRQASFAPSVCQCRHSTRIEECLGVVLNVTGERIADGQKGARRVPVKTLLKVFMFISCSGLDGSAVRR
jgi:hypothetical protein